MNRKNFFLLCLLILGLFSVPLASAYEIIGDSVIKEDSFSKIEVYPHTVYSPILNDLVQTFELTNKTGSAQQVYIGYIFDQDLISGKVEKINDAVHNWVSHEFVCLNEFEYTIDYYEGQRNPNYLKCYSINDNNTPSNTSDDFEENVIEMGFKTGDIPSQTVNYDVWEMTVPETRNNVTSNFNKGYRNGKTIYYYDSAITFGAGETKKWDLTFTPQEGTGKWELVYYVGSNQGCILNGTCDYVQILDPWWDTSFSHKIPIAVTPNGITGRYFLEVIINSTTLGDKNATFWANVRSDGFDIRFLDSTETTVLESHRDEWIDGVSAKFTVEILSIAAENIFLYFGNASASDDSNSLVTLGVFDDFADGDFTNNPPWSSSGGWGVVSNALKITGVQSQTISTEIPNGNVSVDLNVVQDFDANWTMDWDGTNVAGTFWVLADNSIVNNSNNGVSIQISQNTDIIRIIKWNNGVEFNLFSRTSIGGATSADYRARLLDGNFSVFKDGEILFSTLNMDVNAGLYTGFFYEASNAGSVFNADNIDANYTIPQLPTIVFGSIQVVDITASFTATFDNPVLDPDGGINNINVTLTDTSIVIGSGETITDWNYFIDTVQFFHSTVNGNTNRIFDTVGDFNVSLIITGNLSNESQQDQTISITKVVQDIDINFSFNSFTILQADVNFGVTFTGSANAFNWGFPQDSNITTRNAQKIYTSSGEKTVCITIANSADVNTTSCENFFVGRVIIKIPKDAETFVNLSPFNVDNSALPPQSLSGLSVDFNVFVFNDSTNFDSLISIDFNSDYFPTQRTFAFNSFLHTWQPFLVANDGTNLEATIFTINNPKGRVTVSGIRIDSFTDINGVSTLVESKFSDGTGQAIFHFVKSQEYTLKFFDSDGVLLMSQTIETNNLNYFAYLELGTLDLIPTTFLIVVVDWHPTLGNVIPDADGNVSFWQLLRPQNGTIGDVNVFISHISDSNIVFNQVFTVNSSSDFNLSFDLNVAGFNDSFPLKISLQIFDDNSVQVGSIRTNSFGFKDTGFAGAVEGAKDALGQFGVTLIALIITVMIVGFFTSKAIGEDTNLPALGLTFLVTLLFVLIGWIPGDAFASGLLFGIGMGIWGLKK